MISGKFLQSKEWAEFQESLGRKIFRIDGALIIKMPLKFGLCYLYCPKAANGLRLTADSSIKKIAEKERAIFLRIEPQEIPPSNFIKTKDIQPRCTQVLDLEKSEEKLLAEMHQKTRYNIRLAERKGVKIQPTSPLFPSPTPSNSPSGRGRDGENEEMFDEFYNLLKQTSERQDIRLHPKKYYEKLLNYNYSNLRGRASYCNKIFIAYYKDEPIAGALVNFYEDIATYLHGGSTQKHKEVMSPYLLHWKIIKTAKARGIKFYDWWGVDEKKWPGITRFKKGFGGEEICAPGAFDLPIDKFWYLVYKLWRR